MTFTPDELNTIRAACETAAEVYDSNAAHLLVPRLQEQFRRQARQARAIVERIEQEG